MRNLKKFATFTNETFEPRKTADRAKRLETINKIENVRLNNLRSKIAEYNELERDIEDLHSYLEVDSPGEEIAKILKDDAYKSLSRTEIWKNDDLLDRVKKALKERNKAIIEKMKIIFDEIAEHYPILKNLEKQMIDNPLLGQNIYGNSGNYTIDTPNNYNDDIEISMIQANEYRDFLKDKGVKIDVDDYEYHED